VAFLRTHTRSKRVPLGDPPTARASIKCLVVAVAVPVRSLSLMPIPDFVVELRRYIGHAELWMPGVTAVVRRGQEVLLVRRSDNGEWAPVTGIVDPGEEPAVCAAREVFEETGVVVSVDRLASTSVMRDVTHPNGDRAAYLDLCFACSWLSGEARIGDDESAEVRWWSLDDLPPMKQIYCARIDAAISDEQAARFVG
jgi:ADP-ribose pyrophosphatase YjhB (NUDIX family)